jgi:lipid-A-disaccharide synthase
VQFIAPAVWAWRAGRITAVARAVDHLLAVFPFEQALFEKAGIRCSFVGHPLARAIPREPNAPAARARLKLSIDAPTLAVLPGSRRAEIEALGPPFVATIDALLRGDARLQVVVPAADETLGLRLAQMLDGLSQRARVHLLRGHSHDALEAADVALVAGGTATLEAMLFKRPMVIAYKVPPLTEWLTRRKALIPYFGLPNILAQRFIVPEYLQKDVTPRMLVPAVLRYFDSDQEVDGLRDRFAALHETLLRDTPALFAEAVSELARGGRAQLHY